MPPEIARIKDLNVSLRIISFTNSPCPKGAVCFWSEVEVIYELTVIGKTYQYSSGRGANPYDVSYEAPYDVFVKGSDYETYAEFVIDTPDAKCLRLNQDSNSLCWTGLAKRFKNPSYCQKINRAGDKERCVDNLR